MQIRSAAPRVRRGWIAASVCSWTAFAAHAQVAPTIASGMIMLLITCVSAVIAMALLSRKFTLLGTSLVVLLSQGLYHAAISVMSHAENPLVVTAGSGVHAHHVTALNVMPQSGNYVADSMVLAHLLAAVVSIFLLRQGERIALTLSEILSLATVRRILALMHRAMPPVAQLRPIVGETRPIRSQARTLLPLLRGPPSPVLISA